MDDLVKKAMIKWPNVPDCYGWLGLDARGRWFMRDEAAQNAGDFASGLLPAKGSELKHEKLIEFIGRNYSGDAKGQWFFQNGPQRVYVELQATPWVWRVEPDHAIYSHTGIRVQFEAAFVDEDGRLYFSTNIGLGLVHSQDVYRAVQAVEDRGCLVEETNILHLRSQYKYIVSPAQMQKSQH